MKTDFGSNVVKFSQTTRGIWYCSEIAVYSDSVLDALCIIEKAVGQIETFLEKKNKSKRGKEEA